MATLVGGLQMYDSAVLDEVGPIYPLRSMELRSLAKSNLTRFDFSVETSPPEDCWEECGSALAILDESCPEASEWARERWVSGKLKFLDHKEHVDLLGRYDYLKKEVTLTTGFFRQSEGDKAVTIAHEYRHSRQSATKFLRRVLCMSVNRAPCEELVEDDADIYEHRLHIAIFDS